MPKTCHFLTSLFSGFGLDFGGSWASNLELSGPFWPQNLIAVALLSHLEFDVFEKWRLGGLRARFWSPPGWFLEGLVFLFSETSLAACPAPGPKLQFLQHELHHENAAF